MSARQMQKLIKNDELVLLAVIRISNDFVRRGRGIRGRKRESLSYTAVNFVHGMTEGQKRKIKKDSEPKKDMITVKG